MNRPLAKIRLAIRYARGLATLRPSDVWLAAFPKTGSTWLRFIIANLCLQHDGQPPADFHYIANHMPGLGNPSLYRQWPHPTMPRFVKTHRRYTPLLFARPRRTLYLTRFPGDTLVSYYHFLGTSKAVQFTGSFGDFIRHPRYGLAAIMQHYQSWQPHISMVLRYEDMKANPTVEIARMAAHFALPATTAHIEQAVERSSLNEMRKIEQEKGIPQATHHSNMTFVRSGQVNQWEAYFEARDLVYYRQVVQRYHFDLYPVP